MGEDRSRWQRYRDGKRGGPPRKLAPCGTVAAARRHARHGEELDAACAEAIRVHNQAQYQARKAAGKK